MCVYNFPLVLQNRFSGLLTQVTAFMGPEGAAGVESMITKLEQLKGLIDQVHNQIRDPEKTTFVCVCIPEFLSIYETERLVQELSKSEIDTHNVVVNQVLFPDQDAEDLVEWYKDAKGTLPEMAQTLIGKTIARKRMQDRYIQQIFELYEDFHVTLMPLLDNEVILYLQYYFYWTRIHIVTIVLFFQAFALYLHVCYIILFFQVRGVASIESFSSLLLQGSDE